jgi:hypothetical protein
LSVCDIFGTAGKTKKIERNENSEGVSAAYFVCVIYPDSII